MKWLHPCILWVGLSFAGYSQPSHTFGYINFTEADGLAGSTVYCMAQDGQNYMWLGTNNGLCWFDGQQFIRFRHRHGILPRLILSIIPLNDSTLIIYGHRPGYIQVIDPRLARFGALKIKSLKAKHNYHSGTALGHDLLFWNSQSISRFDPEKMEISTFDLPASFSQQQAALFSDPLKHSIHFVPLIYALRDPHQRDHLLTYFKKKTLFGLAKARDQSLWYHTQEGFYHLKEGALTFDPIPWRRVAPNYRYYKDDAEGNIWFTGTLSGLYRYDPDRHKIEELSSSFSIEERQVTSLFCDHKGDLWFGVEGKGLYYLPIGKVAHYSDRENLRGSSVLRLIAAPDSKYYIGTNKGINFFEKGKGLFSPKLADMDGQSHNTAVSAWLSPHYLHDLFYHNHVLYYVSSLSKKPREIWWRSQPLILLNGSSVSTYHGDTLIVGGWHALHLVVPANGGYHVVKRAPSFGLGKTFKTCRFQGRTWLASSEGIFQETEKSLEFKPVKPPVFIEANRVDDLAAFDLLVREDTLWIATNYGILRYYRNTWLHLREEENPYINYRSLTRDAKGRLWIASNRGLYRYNGKALVRFGKEIGLISQNLNTVLFDTLQDQLLIGSADGFSIVKTEALEGMSQEEALQIDYIRLMDEDSTFTGTSVELSHRQNSFTIAYSTAAFTSPGKTWYRYRLKGANAQWRYTDRRSASYVGLEPGNYTFEVSAKHAGTSWNTPAVQAISITPPFYKRLVFISSSSAVFVLLVCLGVLYWTRKVKGEELRKREHLVQMAQLEQKAISSTLNPHFIFNALNSIQYFLSRDKNPSREAIDYIADFSHLIRENMEASQHRTIQLSMELERLELYLRLEQSRMEKKMAYTIHVQPGVQPEEVYIPSMLLQPFVENAIWHGIIPSEYPGYITIEIGLQERFLHILIQDNGIGLERPHLSEHHHISRGIALSRERLLLLSPHNRIDLRNRKDTRGAEVRIYLELQD